MSDADRFISPAVDSFDERTVASRPPSLGGARIGLVDSMLNPGALWGQGILDGIERSIGPRVPNATFERVERSPFAGGLGPDGWAEAMKDRYSALVVAVGD